MFKISSPESGGSGSSDYNQYMRTNMNDCWARFEYDYFSEVFTFRKILSASRAHTICCE